MTKLFGTDGIRGVANQYPMTPAMAVRVGQAVGLFFKKGGSRSSVVVGRDTRISGGMLASGVMAGLASTGVDVLDAGILPTPAIAFLARQKEAAAAVVITASHNPFEDNGFKIFNGSGVKLTDGDEASIEALIQSPEMEETLSTIKNTGIIKPLNPADAAYLDFLAGTLENGLRLDGLRLVVDCSNGATYHVAPELFSRLGADVTVLSGSPNGKNINAGCGSEHPETLSRLVMEEGAGAGLAFDGDGDRLIAVDETGRILTGDQIVAILADYLSSTNRIGDGKVVTTVMSNLGLKAALESMGLQHITCQVGDRYVMEKMVETGAILGGENSGHMILRGHHTTGDGLLSGLKLMEAMSVRKKTLSELSRIMTVYPQHLVNVPVTEKPPLESLQKVTKVVRDAETELGKKGRVLVRYSGTQQICRVMVEGPTVEATEKWCGRIAEAVKAEIG